MTLRLYAALLALLLPEPVRADSQTHVDVAKRGAVYVVDVVMTVPVPLALAWAVMNDFDAMARFVPNLNESRVAARDGNRWTVLQKGVAPFGPFRIAFESVRELELTPTERVVSHQLRGSMRHATSRTTFASAPSGTRITYHAEMEPSFWVPGFVSRRIIEQRVHEQFTALAAEMMRRLPHAASSTPEAK